MTSVPPDDLGEFKKYMQDEMVSKTQSVMTVGVGLIILLSSFDFLNYPALAPQFFVLRVIWCIPFLLVAYLLQHQSLRPYAAHMLCFIVAICGLVLSYFVYRTNDPHNIYFAGIMLTFQGAYLANPIYVRLNSLAGLLCIFFYLLAQYAVGLNQKWTLFMSQNVS